MDRDELITGLTNSNVKLSTRLEQLAKEFVGLRDDLLSVRRVIVELHATIDEERHESRHQLQVIGERLAVISKDVDDAEKAVREVTGSHPTVALDVSDTDRTIGKFVRTSWRKAWPWFASTTVGGGLIHLLHALHILK
jgi:hypothetical protein